MRKVLIALSMLGCGTTAGAEWYQASGRHFVVYADDSPERIKAYAARLERFDRAVRVLHGTSDDDNRGDASRVTVFVVDDLAAVRRLAYSNNVAGFWQPRTLPVAFMPRNIAEGGDRGFTPQAVMFHEYTHHWMLTNWTDAAFPAWYTEGAAELHATAIMRPDGSVVFGAVPLYRSFGVNLKNQLPVSRLLRAVPGSALSPEQTAALYGRGWLLTHYLTFDAQRRAQLADYITAINSGKTIDQAATMLGDTSGLDLKLDSYGKRPMLPSITITADELKTGEITVRKLSPGEGAAMPLRIRSTAGVNKTTASATAAAARRLAASYPNDAAVLNQLAEAEYDNASLGPAADAAAGYARADVAAALALAADPKSVHAMMYRGMAAEALAVADKKTDAATWTGVRRWYLAANRADTESPEPLLAFYNSFEAAKQTPTAGAEKGLLYAYALAPHDTGARFAATKVLLRQGQVKAARAAIAPVAYRADAEGGNALRKVLVAIDDGGATAALAEIKRQEDAAEAKRGEPKKN